jgi:hypothetical protein
VSPQSPDLTYLSVIPDYINCRMIYPHTQTIQLSTHTLSVPLLKLLFSVTLCHNKGKRTLPPPSLPLVYCNVVLWYCGIVILWYCGIVVLWYCCIVVLWYCGIVELWSCGIVILLYYCIVVLWYCGIMVLWYCSI